MKALAALSMLLPSLLLAQSTFTIGFYTEEAQEFHLFLGDEPQTLDAAPCVIIEQVPESAMKLGFRISFIDAEMEDLRGKPDTGMAHFTLYRIDRRRKEMRLEIVSAEDAEKVRSERECLVTVYRGGTDAITPEPVSTPPPRLSFLRDEPESPEGTDDDPENYEGPTGCVSPADAEEADDLLTGLARALDDEERERLLTDMIAGRCLTAMQQQSMLLMFDSEKGKLAAAKKLYPILYDRANAILLQDALGSSANWEAYLKFINYYSE